MLKQSKQCPVMTVMTVMTVNFILMSPQVTGVLENYNI